MFFVNTPEDTIIGISNHSSLRVIELNNLYHIWMQEGNKRLASYDNRKEAEENLKLIKETIVSGKNGWDLKNEKEL